MTALHKYAHPESQSPLPDGDARYRHLMEQATDAIVLFDERLRISEVNRATEMMLGYAHGELDGRLLTDILDPEDMAANPPQLDQLWRGGVILRERTLVRKDGSRLVVEVHTRRIAPGYFFGTARDVTERRQLEARLRHAEKLEAIGLLAGGVAHDFNNHLTVIRGHCDLLIDSLDALDERSADAYAIRQAAERASQITAQLLAFGRRQVLQPVVFDVNASIDALLPMLRRLVGADVLIATDLMPAPALIRADPVQFEQLMVNFVANARDAMPRGGALEIRVSIIPCPRGRIGHREVVLEVADTGHGMDEETRARIFEPFFTTKPFGAGTGLGLATVYGIVQQSGGHIECISAPGEGTTFRVLFDAVEGSFTDTGSFRIPGPAPRGCETILLVEDDEPLRHLLERVLGRLGYLVVTAQGAVDAIALAAHIDEPALTIADLVLPDGDGLAMAQELAERWPQMSTIFISGYGPAELARRGVDSTQIDVLAKPFDTQELAERVRASIDAQRKRA